MKMLAGLTRSAGRCSHEQPEDHWSCIAHLSAENMLKSVVIEKRCLKISNLIELDQG